MRRGCAENRTLGPPVDCRSWRDRANWSRGEEATRIWPKEAFSSSHSFDLRQHKAGYGRKEILQRLWFRCSSWLGAGVMLGMGEGDCEDHESLWLLARGIMERGRTSADSTY